MSSDLKKEVNEDASLVRNFHWEIMRARRAKHITQEELAETIYPIKEESVKVTRRVWK